MIYLDKEWEREPDQKTFQITGRGPMYPTHRKKRIRKKWAKRYGYRDEKVTLHAVIVRAPLKQLNGYIGVPKRHPWYKHPYWQHPSLEAHGGLTFSGWCRGFQYDPNPFWSNWWYFGFDTAHFMDYVPGLAETFEQLQAENRSLSEMLERLQTSGLQQAGRYRNLAYVEDQTRQLAEQILAAGSERVE